jgi:hypothetical protein
MEELQFVQALVDAAVRHEFLVRADLANTTLFENYDLISAANGRKAVRYDYGRAILYEISQSLLHQALGFCVQG